MKTGDKVRVKSLDEVLKIEGVEDYRDVNNPRISKYMLSYFGKEGSIHSCNDCYISVYVDGVAWFFKKEWLEVIVDEVAWVYKKEWLEPVSIVGVEEIKDPTYDDLKPLFIDTEPKDVKKYHLYNPVKNTYFNYHKIDKYYVWNNTTLMLDFQTKFTEEEIKNHEFRDIMELLEKEEV